jgi:hypothetical protein
MCDAEEQRAGKCGFKQLLAREQTELQLLRT